MLRATYADDKMVLTDKTDNKANLKIADVKQSNGMIHVIDGLLMPKQ